MKNNSGHHFCDHCDDIAFGGVCRTCGRTARWIANQPAKQPAKPTRTPAETAGKFFNEIHALIASAPDQ